MNSIRENYIYPIVIRTDNVNYRVALLFVFRMYDGMTVITLKMYLGQSYDPKDFFEMIKQNGGTVPPNFIIKDSKHQLTPNQDGRHFVSTVHGIDPKMANADPSFVYKPEINSVYNPQTHQTVQIKNYVDPTKSPRIGGNNYVSVDNSFVEEKQLYPGIETFFYQKRIIEDI